MPESLDWPFPDRESKHKGTALAHWAERLLDTR